MEQTTNSLKTFTLFPKVELTLEEKNYLEMIRRNRTQKINKNLPNVSSNHAGILFSELVKSASDKIRIFSHALNSGVLAYFANDLVDFLNRGGIIEIVCEKKPSDDNYIHKIIQYYNVAKNLKISKDFLGSISLNINPAAAKVNIGDFHYHFATFDQKAFRLETDTEKRKALANFNDPKFSGLLINLFDSTIKVA